MQKSNRQERHMYIRAAFCSLLVALFVVWPLPIEMKTSLSGHPGNDIWNHVWGHWWVYDSIKSGEIPFHTDLLSYPNGGTLYFIDTIQAILMLPIQFIFGVVFACFFAWFWYGACLLFCLVLVWCLLAFLLGFGTVFACFFAWFRYAVC